MKNLYKKKKKPKILKKEQVIKDKNAKIKIEKKKKENFNKPKKYKNKIKLSVKEKIANKKKANAKSKAIRTDKQKAKNKIINDINVVWMKDSAIKTIEKQGAEKSIKTRRNIKVHTDSKGIAVCKVYSKKNTPKEREQIRKGNKVELESFPEKSLINTRIYSVGSNNKNLTDTFPTANLVISDKDKKVIANTLVDNKKTYNELKKLKNR